MAQLLLINYCPGSSVECAFEVRDLRQMETVWETFTVQVSDAQARSWAVAMLREMKVGRSD